MRNKEKSLCNGYGWEETAIAMKGLAILHRIVGDEKS